MVYVIQALTVLIALCALAVVRVRDTFGLIVLLSVFSGLLATMFAILGAADVSFTEAVVGGSVSVIFLMALMWWVRTEMPPASVRRHLVDVLPALALGVLLFYGVNALPTFGTSATPSMEHVSPDYIANSLEHMDTPNVVTAVLADYRSFDTLIESAVVLAAALGCMLVLRERLDETL